MGLCTGDSLPFPSFMHILGKRTAGVFHYSVRAECQRNVSESIQKLIMDTLAFDKNVKLNSLFYKGDEERVTVCCNMETLGEHKALLDRLVSRLRSRPRYIVPDGRRKRPHKRTSKPDGRRKRPHKRTSKPDGRRKRPHKRTSKPDGRRKRPHKRTSKPDGRRKRPHKRTSNSDIMVWTQTRMIEEQHFIPSNRLNNVNAINLVEFYGSNSMNSLLILQ